MGVVLISLLSVFAGYGLAHAVDRWQRHWVARKLVRPGQEWRREQDAKAKEAECACPLPRETQEQLITHGGIITRMPKEVQ